MKDTAAIIVAGGKGLRFGACLPAGRGAVRKQYLLLKGKPILWWSIQAFRSSPSIAEIILVVPKDDLKQLLGTVPKVRIVAGGATRADSVREGLRALSKNVRYAAVHDAVSPLIAPEVIEKVIAAARRYRAAIAAIPSKDTVKLANGDGCIHSTPPRETVWLAQTPQIFERKLLERAHKSGRQKAVTDDAQLVERLGVRVKLVESSPENLKVTLPMDFVLARRTLEERS